MYNFRNLAVAPLISHSLACQLYTYFMRGGKRGKRSEVIIIPLSSLRFPQHGKISHEETCTTGLKHVNWYILLAQPSSAAAELVFSILASTFSAAQESSLKDYVQLSVTIFSAPFLQRRSHH